jgi:hypothetical protein
MARVYRQHEKAIESLRGALGALSAASGEGGEAYAFACGYAQYGVESALEYLGAGDEGSERATFVEGYSAVVDALQPELPFEGGADGR